MKKNKTQKDLYTGQLTLQRSFKLYKVLYLMMIPGILFYILFKYVPMVGLLIAFEDYQPFSGFSGIFSGLTEHWVGLKWFKRFLSSIYAERLIGNSFTISFKKLLFGFPTPIMLAILLSSLTHKRYTKFVQTVSYLPHFLSTVIICSIVRTVTSTDGGLINMIIKAFGGTPIFFIGRNDTFQGTLVATTVWSTIGWNSIIYLAAITGIDPALYEAATVDGADWHQKIWHVTLPALAPIISLMLILRCGDLLDAGFDQILQLYSSMVYKKGDIIDTYVYREGLLNLKYSYSTAVNMFKSVLALVLVLSSNFAAKKMGQEGIW